jgi:hypothetical protein
MDRRHVFRFPILVILALCCGAAAPWTLTPIAKPVRGVGYAEAVIVDGVIVFEQLGTKAAIKRWEDGSVSTLVPQTAQIPKGEGHFIGFGPIAFDGTRVAFVGHGASKEPGGFAGVYLWNAGARSQVVDSHVTVPGRPDDNFRYFHSVSVGGSLIAIDATDDHHFHGVYDADADGVHVIAVPGTTYDNGHKAFTETGGGFVSNGAVIFHAQTTTDSSHFVQGIYAWQKGTITRLLDTTQSFPPGGRFISMDLRSVDGTDLAGNGGFGGTGVFFKYAKGKPAVVASFRNPAPGVVGRVNAIEDGAIKNGSVLCLVGHDAQRILVSDFGGTLAKVLGTGDPLDGKTVAKITLTPQAFDGKRAVITVYFSDMSTMIYIATPDSTRP